MNTVKHQYLESIRANTAYPVYRTVIDTIALLWYLLAAVAALGAIVGGLAGMRASFVVGVMVFLLGGVAAAIVFVLARLSKEAALVLADLADSTIEANSHQRV